MVLVHVRATVPTKMTVERAYAVKIIAKRVEIQVVRLHIYLCN